jgi:hypothetical protein
VTRRVVGVFASSCATSAAFFGAAFLGVAAAEYLEYNLSKILSMTVSLLYPFLLFFFENDNFISSVVTL